MKMIERNPFMSHIVLLKLVDLNSQSVINYLLAYDRISVHTFSQIMSSEFESIWRLNHVNWPKHETNHRWTTDPSAPDPSAPALNMDSLLTDVLFWTHGPSQKFDANLVNYLRFFMFDLFRCNWVDLIMIKTWQNVNGNQQWFWFTMSENVISPPCWQHVIIPGEN